MAERRILVAGGGAAGFFGAIACKEADPSLRVTLLEATAHPLAKVRVSGGGRCNVTNACPDPREIARHYPRGGRELIGPLTRWGTRETVAWFEARGVKLHAEADGRMFPVTNRSETVVDCLLQAAGRAGVEILLRCGLRGLAETVEDGGFIARLTTGSKIEASRVLIATGGTRGSAGTEIAAGLGHAIEPAVPSLFAFDCSDPLLRGLAGLSLPYIAVRVPETRLASSGPVLVTHRGLSGPAILKLSAWGARQLHATGYAFPIDVNWVAPRKPEAVERTLADFRTAHPRRQIATWNAFGLPSRLWERIATSADIKPTAPWTSLSNTALQSLRTALCGTRLSVSGKSLNKEEFVTCGGVRLAEVDFRTMESRIRPGLHFAGEVLDIDGLTGGFNFQSAWTTGWHAGRALAGASGAEP